MNQFTLDILRRGTIEDGLGGFLPLHSHTSQDQAEFLTRQIREIEASVTLEIGLAYGISALCICDAIQDRPEPRHYAIDPYQMSESWNGLGLRNLERAGLRDICAFYPEPAQTCLPELLKQNTKLDFAYIDAGKRMDDILLFTHYIERMLRVGGRIAFDDVCFPGIRKALRYLVQQPHFRVVAKFDSELTSFKRRFVRQIARAIPGSQRFVDSEVLRLNREFEIDGKCVVIEKIAEVDSDWKWHPDF